MTTNRTLTDSQIETLADEAEAGYDVDQLVARRDKRGRPTLGAGPASVESVRLDPELKDQLLLRAEQDHTSPSDVIRINSLDDRRPALQQRMGVGVHEHLGAVTEQVGDGSQLTEVARSLHQVGRLPSAAN